MDNLSNNSGYIQSGTIGNINGITTNGYVTFPDGSTDSDGIQFGFVFQGYLFAIDGPGEYSIESANVDDVGMVWDGDNAYENNWNFANADYFAGYGEPNGVTLTLLANEARPLNLLWMNADEGGRSSFVITGPTGTVYRDTSQLLFADCGGNFNP